MNNSIYKGYAVYRFLDKTGNTIYIGRSKNIYNRIYKQHFTSKGHLPYKCYDSTCIVEFIKLDNNAECKALEDFLIDKYRPIFNSQDKSKSFKRQSFGELEDYLVDLEKWKRYRFIKPLDNNSIVKSKFHGYAAYMICLILFFSIIYEFIFK